jgi:subfamily B ATP-binding cassette protein MsbA
MKKSALHKKQSSFSIYRRLVRYGLPYWKMFAVSVVSMSIYAMLGPAFAKLIQPLIDGSFIEHDPSFLRQAPYILLGLSLIRAITGFLGDYCSGWVGRRIIADMRRQLFGQFLNLPCGYYDRASSGELLSKLLYNTEQVAQAMTEGAVNLIKDGLSMVGLTALMLYENIQLSMIFLIVAPILGVSVRKITLRFRKISSRIQDSMGSVGHVTQEVIEAQRIVKVFNGKPYETLKFAKENEHNQRQQMKLITTNAMSGSVIQLIYVSGFAAILYVVSLDAVRQTITPGSLIAFIAAMAMMQSPIKRFTQAIGLVQKGVAASESIFDMVDMEREKDDGSLELDKVEGRIEYRNVSLGYRERQEKALDGISLTVPAGKTIALVGQSGSGKTSLIRLLPRLYDATEGQILIDGHDIRDFTLDNLRKHIAYVGQEVTLFNDTVANNIAYGCRDQLPLESIRDAAKAAYALEFIEQLPQGFDTQVGQQGIVLSGGQRQRIAIARALLKNAPILILDEATSALDAESERYVQDALEVLMRNRTTLIVAHRLSTIQNAEKIYVMRAGGILESGTHEELMARESFYAELNRMQFNASGEA